MDGEGIVLFPFGGILHGLYSKGYLFQFLIKENLKFN